VAKANDRQVGGNHYKGMGVEHWDVAWKMNMDYFQGQITKYVTRWRDKDGIPDLEKGFHFYEKYLELVRGNSLEADADAIHVIEDNKPTAYPMVKPTGWWGYTFEGTDGQGSLFTCKGCKTEVRCPPSYFPGDFHHCGLLDAEQAAFMGEPTRAYTGQ
jgi:hypothetical protein